MTFGCWWKKKNPITISIFTYFPSKSEQNIPEEGAEYLIKRPFLPSSTLPFLFLLNRIKKKGSREVVNMKNISDASAINSPRRQSSIKAHTWTCNLLFSVVLLFNYGYSFHADGSFYVSAFFHFRDVDWSHKLSFIPTGFFTAETFTLIGHSEIVCKFSSKLILQSLFR